jgi:adenosylcobyric acid synthase
MTSDGRRQMTRAPALMFQGTGSHVGKSTLVAGLCRALVRRGIKVAPFKPQNMSNNAAVAADGGEIGRAQALQAQAARLAPSVHMNPVLLKPETDTGAQIIVQGRRAGTMRAAEYGRRKSELLPAVLDSYAKVAAGVEIVIVEGAGSPAEVNLRAGDLANMGFAEAVHLPVVLVGDIDRGGVIASIVGTHAVLSPEDRRRVRGFVVNKMRGDAGLFADGIGRIEQDTGWPCLGVVPWFEAAGRLPAEDVLGLADGRQDGSAQGVGRAVIAVPLLPRIANFDDLDPLRAEPGASVVVVKPGEPIPAEARLVLIPGSKSTIADLAFLRAEGWDVDIRAHVRRGGRVLGICGGYQMLGRSISDPEGVEGSPGTVDGLGLLEVETFLTPEKTTTPAIGRDIVSGEPVAGYEIHLGRTGGADCARPVLDLGGRLDGARSSNGLVAGTYVHGIFAADRFRRAYLADLGVAPSDLRYEAMVEATLDALADHLERHVDVAALLAISGYSNAIAPAMAATAARSNAFAPR